MADTGCDALDAVWTTDLATALELTGDKVELQGNLNPAAQRPYDQSWFAGDDSSFS